jgi:ribonuclease P protein component
VAKQFTLGENERLKSRKEIEQLFSLGTSISVFPFHIYYSLTQRAHDFSKKPLRMPAAIQFGVGVSGKNFKRALDRNRIKRLIREAYRLQKNALYQIVEANNLRLNMFFIYTARELPDYQVVYNRMSVALQKISTAIEKNRGK